MTAEEACRLYEKRFRIETFFSDQKSRGFHLHTSSIADPQRLSRLLIAACLASLWIIYLGSLCEKERKFAIKSLILRRCLPMSLQPNRVDYLPMIDRPIIKWPNNARVAFWVAPNIEHYEYFPLLDGVRNPWPRTPLPDVQQYSLHEYGNRVGFWRVLEVLDHY